MTKQNTTYHWLDKLQYPLANKFYRAEGERGKVRGDDRCAVIKSATGVIWAALCLRRVGDASLLMSMAVGQKHRGNGYARRLLRESTAQLDDKTYTFSYANLVGFYASEGFCEVSVEQLPDILRQRFISYQDQGRNIVAMRYQPTSHSSR
jgi:N-acetylglutamate synthase-like GNAT family acetyltransferase